MSQILDSLLVTSDALGNTGLINNLIAVMNTFSNIMDAREKAVAALQDIMENLLLAFLVVAADILNGAKAAMLTVQKDVHRMSEWAQDGQNTIHNPFDTTISDRVSSFRTSQYS